MVFYSGGFCGCVYNDRVINRFSHDKRSLMLYDMAFVVVVFSTPPGPRYCETVVLIQVVEDTQDSDEGVGEQG